jgi:hypothetical protein
MTVILRQVVTPVCARPCPSRLSNTLAELVGLASRIELWK